MKTTLLILPAIFLTACASDPKPRVVSVSSAIPGRILPAEGIESVRYSENLKAYPVGRYVDPNSNLVMHEGHTVYRVETTAKWNLHPAKPTAVPMGPPVGVVDPARREPPINPEVIAEVNKQKAATQTLIDQGTKINQTISQLSGAFKLTQELGEQNQQLRQELTTTQKRLEALEQELRKQQTEVVFGPNKKTNDW